MEFDRDLPNQLWRTFLAGLAAVLPLAITLYLIYWLGFLAESTFGGLFRAVLPDRLYFPGLGIVLAALVILAVGVFMKQWLFSRIVELAEGAMTRIPLVKTIYGGVRDILDFLSRASQRRDLKRVVLVELDADVHVIGFVTDDEVEQVMPELAGDAGERPDDDPLIAVYMPMSYQIGGYTLYLPASRVKTLDIPIEDAMRVVLTAGVNRPRR